MMWLRTFSNALAAFADPRVVFCCLAFIALYLAYSHTLRRTTSVKESEGAAAPGCLLQVLGTLFEGAVTGLFTLILLHSLWKRIPDPPHVESFALLAIRAGIVASLMLTLLSLLPLLGRFLARRPGLQIFLLGVGTYRFTAPLYFERSSFGALGLKLHLPSLGLSLLYLGLCLFLSEVLFWIHRVATRGWETNPNSFSEKYLMPSLDILTGIFPLLMYIQLGEYYLKP